MSYQHIYIPCHAVGMFKHSGYVVDIYFLPLFDCSISVHVSFFMCCLVNDECLSDYTEGTVGTQISKTEDNMSATDCPGIAEMTFCDISLLYWTHVDSCGRMWTGLTP